MLDSNDISTDCCYINRVDHVFTVENPFPFNPELIQFIEDEFWNLPLFDNNKLATYVESQRWWRETPLSRTGHQWLDQVECALSVWQPMLQQCGGDHLNPKLIYLLPKKHTTLVVCMEYDGHEIQN